MPERKRHSERSRNTQCPTRVNNASSRLRHSSRLEALCHLFDFNVGLNHSEFRYSKRSANVKKPLNNKMSLDSSGYLRVVQIGLIVRCTHQIGNSIFVFSRIFNDHFTFIPLDDHIAYDVHSAHRITIRAKQLSKNVFKEDVVSIL